MNLKDLIPKKIKENDEQLDSEEILKIASVNEDAVSYAKKEYDKGNKFQESLLKLANEYNVDEKYVKLYKEVAESFQYLVWTEMYNDEYPNAMPSEKYAQEKQQYTKILDKYTGRYE